MIVESHKQEIFAFAKFRREMHDLLTKIMESLNKCFGFQVRLYLIVGNLLSNFNIF